MSHLRFGLLLGCTLLPAAVTCRVAAAEGAQTAGQERLRDEVDALKIQVQQLERRLANIEALLRDLAGRQAAPAVEPKLGLPPTPAAVRPFDTPELQLRSFEPEVRQKIMHDNAARLLGLQTATAGTSTGNTYGQSATQVSADLVGEIVREVMARMKN